MESLSSKLIILWILCGLNVLYIPNTAASRPQSAPIVSGVRAVPGEYPWHVLIKKYPCGGSIISNLWVLTAGHCVRNETSVFMIFGTVELDSGPINMTSKTLFAHPTADVGLIKLPTPLTFNDIIQPIGLITTREAANNNFIGASTFICGFGSYRDDNQTPSPWLLWGAETVVNNTVCARYFGPMANSLLCTIPSTSENHSPCSGDSGGALVWRSDIRTYKQIGIASFAKVQKCSAFPTGYVRVASYLKYINRITGLKFE